MPLAVAILALVVAFAAGALALTALDRTGSTTASSEPLSNELEAWSEVLGKAHEFQIELEIPVNSYRSEFVNRPEVWCADLDGFAVQIRSRLENDGWGYGGLYASALVVGHVAKYFC